MGIPTSWLGRRPRRPGLPVHGRRHRKAEKHPAHRSSEGTRPRFAPCSWFVTMACVLLDFLVFFSLSFLFLVAPTGWLRLKVKENVFTLAFPFFFFLLSCCIAWLGNWHSNSTGGDSASEGNPLYETPSLARKAMFSVLKHMRVLSCMKFVLPECEYCLCSYHSSIVFFFFFVDRVLLASISLINRQAMDA